MSALDVVEVQTEAGIPASADASEPAGTYRKRKLGFWFWASIVWLTLLLFGAVLADLLPLKDPSETFRGVARQGPGREHWFGADNIGHDVLSRTIYGARRSLAVAGVATIGGLLMGTAVGLVSGFYRRAIDNSIQAAINVLLAIPGLVLLLTTISFLAPPGEASASEQTFWVTVS